MNLSSYPSLYNIGHRVLDQLFKGPVTIEEKIDGSQFSFGVIDGQLQARSKGIQLHLDAPENMFLPAINVIKELEDKLTPGWIYRGEYLSRPKHNTLAYDRIPKNHIMIFDIMVDEERYLNHANKVSEAERLGFEVVPLVYEGNFTQGFCFEDTLKSWIDRISVLGGNKAEGIVIKNYNQFGPDKKIIIGKFVSDQFKEIHRKTWKETHLSKTDFFQLLGSMYRTEARWRKAIQHLAERGELKNERSDIGKLLTEVNEDIAKECKDEILEQVWKHIKPNFDRQVTKGLAEWYLIELSKREAA